MAKYGVLVALCICSFVACVIGQKKIPTVSFDCERKITCDDKKPDVKDCNSKLPDIVKEAAAGVANCEGKLLVEDPNAFFCNKEKDDALLTCFNSIRKAIKIKGSSITVDDKEDQEKYTAYRNCINPIYKKCKEA